MSADAVVQIRAVRRPLGGAGWRLLAVMSVSLVLSLFGLLLVPREMVALAAPLFVNVNLALFFVMVLMFNDRRVPVFESGSLWVAATFVYSCFPFLGFMAAGLTWSADMDNRLLQYPFDKGEIAWFAWQYTMYLAAFIFVYLLVRRRAVAPVGEFEALRRSTVIALVTVFLGIQAVSWGLYFVYGINLETSHDAAENLAMIARIAQVPLFVWQVSSHILDASLLGQMGIAIVLVTQWKKRPWTRAVLFLWIAKEAIEVAVRHTARAPVVLLLLMVVLLYHRLIRALSLKTVTAVGVALLVSFVTLGVLRLQTSSAFSLRSALTTTNEFQTLFTTAFDLHQRKELGTLGNVPWQVYAVDLYLEIPRQLLPFEKLDPSVWYLDVLGVRDQGIGYMFGVMAQAVVGLGWIELVARGALLGLLYGLLHRWYVRRATKLWPTMLYVFLSIWSFYTFRATTFWSVHFVVYQFLPFFAATKLIEIVLQRPSLRRGFVRHT